MSLFFDLRGQRGSFNWQAQAELPKGISALLGPSGCGKTSLLRAIAGIDRSEGRLNLQGQTLCDTGMNGKGSHCPSHQRDIAYVFQDAGLFPHLNVAENLDFASKRRKPNPGPERQAIVDALGIRTLLQQRPEQLSGGQRKRVAIARSLLSAPRLLLLDEALSGLDQGARQGLIRYLRKISREYDIDMLVVSHHFDDVAQLADHLLLMEQGHISDSGELLEMSSHPQLAINRQADAASLLLALGGHYDSDDQLAELKLDAQHSLWLPAAQAPKPGKELRLLLHARDVSISLSEDQHSSILNRLPATVEDIVEDGGQCTLRLGIAGQHCLARISRRSKRQLNIEVGLQVIAQIKGVALLGDFA